MLRRVLVVVIFVVAVWELFPGVRTGLRAFAKRFTGEGETIAVQVEPDSAAVTVPIRTEGVVPLIKSAPLPVLLGGGGRDRDVLIRKLEEVFGGER